MRSPTSTATASASVAGRAIQHPSMRPSIPTRSTCRATASTKTPSAAIFRPMAPATTKTATAASFQRRPDVVFFVLESFRADAVGRLVNGKPVTPVLDAPRARGCLVLERVLAQRLHHPVAVPSVHRQPGRRAWRLAGGRLQGQRVSDGLFLRPRTSRSAAVARRRLRPRRGRLRCAAGSRPALQHLDDRREPGRLARDAAGADRGVPSRHATAAARCSST